jgi:hypothetical protein
MTSHDYMALGAVSLQEPGGSAVPVWHIMVKKPALFKLLQRTLTRQLMIRYKNTWRQKKGYTHGQGSAHALSVLTMH